VNDSSLQLLNPQLTPTRLKEALEARGEGLFRDERRPIQLTVYEYAEVRKLCAIIGQVVGGSECSEVDTS